MNTDFDLISLLEKASTQEEETYDVRFEEVVSLVDQEQLDEAAQMISSIFAEGSIDIRLIMYLLYSRFISQGIEALTTIFFDIEKIISHYWDRLSPASTREKHLLTSLSWLLTTIGKKLKRSEKLIKNKKSDDFLNRSSRILASQQVETLIQKTHHFGDFLSQRFKEPTLSQSIFFISKWLESHKTQQPQEKIEPMAKPTEAPPPANPPQKSISFVEILSTSEPMAQLCKKIEAFESLIQKNDFEKAALVADDISNVIKNFDPALFFPKLFSQYFALSAEHIESLSQEWENKGSLKWEALHRLYQSDLDEFIQW